ncbi:unnamed protein product [marine sediment metagenome]|uniref:Uncharacterized protein n=1 Tax=marine sediment metagenome TaxID=412755 RepID=X1T0D7_9ZZZZ
MEDKIVDIFEKPFRPLEALSKAELQDETQRWRNVWTWLEPETQKWLTDINKEVSVTKRNYKVIQGLMGQPHFELVSIDVEWVERIYNYSRGEATYEHKTTTVKLSEMNDFSFIHGKEVKSEQYDGKPPELTDEELDHINLQKEEVNA